MRKLLLIALASLGLITLLAGCGTSERIVAGLVLELSSLEQRADGSVTATVRIVNPNMGSYNFAEATHRIFLGERLVGTLRIDAPTGVPAQMGVEQTGPVTLARGTTLPSGSVRYRLESTVLMRLWGDNTKSHKLTGEGTIAISQK